VSSEVGAEHLRYLLGLTPRQYEMLETLQSIPLDSISRKELQTLTGADPSVVTRNLTKLLKRGLVTREYSLKDNQPPHYRYTIIDPEDFESMVSEAIERLKADVRKVME
jgi:predicted transcriptional regulator